ncbi:MAG: hypothetical protein RL417_1840 [Pseudomonadota bacterium]|jgi:6-phosphogluconolactonase
MAVSVEVVEPVLFAGVVADELVALIGDAIAERGVCTVALAGGSTPGAIYRCLAKPPRVSEVEWSKVHLFWGDERWVPHTDNQSNFKMTQETLLAQIHGAPPQVHPIDTSLPDPESGARAYAEEIRGVLGKDPVFDLVLLGVGEDGHTASLFPHSPVLREDSVSCAATQHPEDKKARVTLTPGVLRKARRVIFIAKGESKADIVRRVLEGTEEPHALPAKLILTGKEGVEFFLDSGAALRLNRTAVG